MTIVLYDSRGTPTAYSDDGEHLYTFAGRAVAYLLDASIYGFSGLHLGRLEHGLVRDNQGLVAFFTDAVTGPGLYVVRPIRQIKPLRGVKQLLPAKLPTAAKPPKPADSLSWSQQSGERFFR